VKQGLKNLKNGNKWRMFEKRISNNLTRDEVSETWRK
jgi:hypothetical protein